MSPNKVYPKITLVKAESPIDRCRHRRTARSVVLCERPKGHEDFHAGRTRSGGWKTWDAE